MGGTRLWLIVFGAALLLTRAVPIAQTLGEKERFTAIAVVNNEREKLAQIDRALAKMADGTYGVCESCGNPIGKGRSMAFPRATLCLTCKQREERR